MVYRKYTGSGFYLAHSLLSDGLWVSYSRVFCPLKFVLPSINEAMLGRATKEYEPPPKPDLRKTLFPSSSPACKGKFPENSKKIRQSSQSIQGYMSQTNSSQPLRSTSPNKHYLTASIPHSNGASNWLFSVLSKQDSFRDPIQVSEPSKKSSTSPTLSSQLIELNEDDFDDDENLGLDIDYDLPTSLPQTLRTTSMSNLPSISQTALRSYRKNDNSSLNISSSAVTWSSSPPSHKISTLRATLSSKRESEVTADECSSQPVRPAKRRTLPWQKIEATDDLIRTAGRGNTKIIATQQLSSSPELKSPRSGKDSHHTKDRSISEDLTFLQSSASTHTRNKSFPWNNTNSNIEVNKKKLKDKTKDSKKMDANSVRGINNRSKVKLAVTPISLSEEQNKVLDLVVKEGKSVFFTGSAGTGKSVLMRAIITELRKKYAREIDRVAVTASTGLAACNIGGVTLHSFGGIGLGKDDVPTLVRKIKRNPKARNRWIKTKVLVIDEVSMVDGDLFDKLEGVSRALRNNGRPFGGIQLVITGDFFQLPPVPEYDNKSRGIKFAFDANTWSSTIHHTIGLTQVFRQKDPVFANMLNEMRLGNITENIVATFKNLSRSISDEGFEATELFPTRNEVDRANSIRMRDLRGECHKYLARDTSDPKYAHMRDKLLSNMMAPKVLELKKGAQVMLIKNMDDGLVNGTLGKVQNFMSERYFKFLEASRDGLDALECEGEEGTEDKFYSSRAGIASMQSEKGLSTADHGTLYPYVSFKLADGTRRMMLILPEDWKVESPNGEIQAQRTQVPLILAWALSIHKAQGQTLERVKIDLKKAFERGQAYVALSRATSQNGLQVLNFDKSKVMAHPKVAQFYNNLYSINKATDSSDAAEISKKLSKDQPKPLDHEFEPDYDESEPDYDELFSRYGFDDEYDEF